MLKGRARPEEATVDSGMAVAPRNAFPARKMLRFAQPHTSSAAVRLG